jgi:hypothetical protein
MKIEVEIPSVEFLKELKVHQLPFEIEHNGQANVKQFFIESEIDGFLLNKINKQL